MVSSRGTGSFSPVQGALQPSAAAARLAPFIRQPALAYGLLGVLRPMPAVGFGVSAPYNVTAASASLRSPAPQTRQGGRGWA